MQQFILRFGDIRLCKVGVQLHFVYGLGAAEGVGQWQGASGCSAVQVKLIKQGFRLVSPAYSSAEVGVRVIQRSYQRKQLVFILDLLFL